MKKVVLFGAGDIAEVAHFYLTHDSEYEVVAFTVDQEYLNDETFCGLPVVPFEKVEEIYPPEKYSMMIAISYARLNRVRANKYYQAKEKGYKLISYVSSKATTWPNMQIGENCFILEDNTIQPFVKIGNNVTLWSGNHIGHHAHIKDHCFITSHVVISGGVEVEENCFIGVNATIRDHVKIEKNTIISAGAWINKSTKENSVYKTQSAELSKLTSDKVKL